MKVHSSTIRAISSLLCMCLGFIASGKTMDYTFSFDASSISVTNVRHSSGQEFVELIMPGFHNSSEENEPALPEALMHFQVPVNASGFSASVSYAEAAQEIKLEKKIRPAENIPSSMREEYTAGEVTFGPSYSVGKTEPEASIINEFFLNGNEHFITVGVSPVVYDPISDTAEIYSSITVRISFDDTGSAPVGFQPLETAGSRKAFEMTDYISCEDGQPSLRKSNVSSSQTDEISHYLILVPDNLKDAVTRLADWKTQKGYQVTVQTVEDILSQPQYKINESGKCFDKEASVREWMKSFYTKNGAFYCLIVGDYRTSAPIRKFKCAYRDLSDPNAKEYEPSDDYFADLVSEWQFSKDSSGLFSCMSPDATFSPTVPVGRLLCDEANEIKRFIKKLIIYELYPGLGDSSYLNKAFLGRYHQSDGGTTLFNYFKFDDLIELPDNHPEKVKDARPYSKDVL
ncbi:MAG: hypothetical protein K2G23_03760, partial [Muribaculaceae bacterium]|nr:hypothetical protein [Muribaculaceae bacterium]